MAIIGTDQNDQVKGALDQAAIRENRGASKDSHGDRRKKDEAPIDTRFTSLTQIGRLNPTPLAMSDTAEALDQFYRDFVEAMPSKDDDNLIQAKVFPIDASVAGLPFSLLVVAGMKKNKPDLGIGYHTFVLAGSADQLQPREESIRGQRVTIVQVPGDAYDDRCRNVVEEVLANHYPETKLVSSDAEVIHRNFPTLKENPDAIANCVKNSYTAIKLALDEKDGDVPLLKLDSESRNTYNALHIQHRQDHIFDRGHQPIRSDVVIDLVTREHRGRSARDPMDQLISGQRISRVGGFYDLIYAPADGALLHDNIYSRRDNRVSGDEHQLYALRFVNTFVDTIDFSLNTFLLAIATLNAAGDEREIMTAFEPNLSLGENEYRNIGALAIETNLMDEERGFSDRVETKSPTFTAARRRALLRATIRPGIIFSFDIPECGASTWQWVRWIAAAQGSRKASDEIYDAACILTNGIFEEYYRRGDPIVDDQIERVHAGYYVGDERGGILDIRDFDYLALLNMLNPESVRDLEVVQRWSDNKFDETVLRQSDRYEIIRRFIPHAVITGMYQRVNLNSHFNQALVDAIISCGLSLNPASSKTEGGERYRSTYGNIDSVINRPGAVGLYRNRRIQRDYDEDRYYDSNRRFEGRW